MYVVTHKLVVIISERSVTASHLSHIAFSHGFKENIDIDLVVVLQL